MKTRITASMIVLMIVFSAAFLSACWVEEQESSRPGIEDEMNQAEKYDNKGDDLDNPVYASEEDGAEVVKKSHDLEDFYGTWKATSDRAEYLFGNIDITIKKNGMWKGNITEENFRGKWSYERGQLFIKDFEEIIDYTMFFNDKGIMLVVDNEDPELPIVLEKQD